MFARGMIVVAMFLAFAPVAPATAGALSVGQDYEFAFSNLPFHEPAPYPNQGGVTIQFRADLLEAGDVVRFELFEDSVGDPAFFTNDFTTPTDHFGASVVSPAPWQDLQGVIRVSVLAGSIEIGSISAQVIRDGSRYFATIPISPVPESSSVYLLAIGIAALSLRFGGFWRDAVVPT